MISNAQLETFQSLAEAAITAQCEPGTLLGDLAAAWHETRSIPQDLLDLLTLCLIED